MARPVRQSSGRWRYQPMGPNRRRLSFRWSPMTDNQAAEIAAHIDALVISVETAISVNRRTALWLADLGDELHEQLAAARLVEPRRSAALAEFIDEYISRGVSKSSTAGGVSKSSTRTRQRSARRRLVDHFGPGRDLRTITSDDARTWHRAMLEDLAPATVARDVGLARQFFNDARRRGFVTDNPFDGLSALVRPDKDRQHYIDPETISAVLQACPDAQWRALVSLARYAGLRVPSEIKGLRWSDIAWDRSRFTVRSPKTEHHTDGDRRVVPLFPEVHAALAEWFDLAEPGEERVFTLPIGQGSALRKPFLAIIARAGLTPWPKLWQNLRSSCQTDLVQRHPQHAVCAWLGNSEKIADRHYLQVTDAHFMAAVTPAEPGAPDGAAQVRRDTQGNPKTAILTHEAASDGSGIPKSGRNRTRTCDLCYVTAAL
jgi:hypothetical protein